MPPHPTPLAEGVSALRRAAETAPAHGWIPAPIHQLLMALLTRLFGRLETMIALWQAGQLPPQAPGSPRTQTARTQTTRPPHARYAYPYAADVHGEDPYEQHPYPHAPRSNPDRTARAHPPARHQRPGSRAARRPSDRRAPSMRIRRPVARASRRRLVSPRGPPSPRKIPHPSQNTPTRGRPCMP